MTEFQPMTNKEFRHRAWELTRQNFWKILSATLIVSLISTCVSMLASLSTLSALTVIAIIALEINSVLVSLGMVRFILNIWHGEPTSIAVLYSQRKRFWTYVCFTVLLALIACAIAIPLAIAIAVPTLSSSIPEIPAIIAMVALYLLLCALLIWISFRFEMTTVCIVLHPEMRATECMRTAWRASKGHVKRLLCNTLVLSLPLLLAQGLFLGYQVFLQLSGQALNGVASAVLEIASMLITALLSGYIYLGSFSLDEYLLGLYTNRASGDGPTAVYLASDEKN